MSSRNKIPRLNIAHRDRAITGIAAAVIVGIGIIAFASGHGGLFGAKPTNEPQTTGQRTPAPAIAPITDPTVPDNE